MRNARGDPLAHVMLVSSGVNMGDLKGTLKAALKTAAWLVVGGWREKEPWKGSSSTWDIKSSPDLD